MPERGDNYYSEPVQEIMGSIPSWITRWGVTVIAGIFADNHRVLHHQIPADTDILHHPDFGEPAVRPCGTV